MVFDSVAGTTHSTERLHSCTGRHVHGRGMTRPLGLSTVAASFAGRAAPPWALGFLSLHRGRGETLKRPRDDASQLQQEQPKKKRRGGGGAWRAWLHLWSSRNQGSPDFAQASVEYAELSAEQKQSLAELGRAGTANHKTGQQAFPMTDCKVLKKLQRERQQQLLHSEGSLGALAPLVAVHPGSSLDSGGLSVNR